MLRCHPELFSVPEQVTFVRPMIGELLAWVDGIAQRVGPAPLRLSGMYRAVAQLHDGDQTSEAMAAAAQWVAGRHDWSSAQLVEYLSVMVAPRRLVEKSPGTVAQQEALDRCMSSHPYARFLHLTRHPVTCELSMQEA
ncbi:MAG: sulfotransferase [Acidimicrobiales bacterium]